MISDHWEFYLEAGQLWCWRRTEASTHLVVKGDRCYAKRDDCVADAMRHGYLEYPALLRPAMMPPRHMWPPLRRGRDA